MKVRPVVLLMSCLSVIASSMECSGQGNDSAVNKIGEAPSKVLYLEWEPTGEGVTLTTGPAHLVFNNLETGESVILEKQLLSTNQPRLSPNGAFIAFFEDEFPNSGPLHVLDYTSRRETRVGLQHHLQVLGVRGITSMDFLNDSTIILAAREKLLRLDITRETVQQLKSIAGGLIMELVADPNGMLIAVKCIDPRDPFGRGQLYLYDTVRDTIIDTKRTLYSILDWSPDGKRVLFNDSLIVLLDTQSDESQSFRFLGNSKVFGKMGLFVDQQTLLFLGMPDATLLGPEDLYLFDLTRRKVAKRITNDGKVKSPIGVFHSR